jgi:hypothetical protein
MNNNMESKTVLTKVTIHPSRLIGDASISFENDKYKAIFLRPIKDETDWKLQVHRKGESESFATITIAENLEEIAFIKDVIVDVFWQLNLNKL